MKLLDIVITTGEYDEPKPAKALVDQTQVESVCEAPDELDIETVFTMKSGDIYATPLSIFEAEDWLAS